MLNKIKSKLNTKKGKVIFIIAMVLLVTILVGGTHLYSLRLNAIEFNTTIAKCNNYTEDKYTYDNLTKQDTLDKTKTSCQKLESDTDKEITELEAKANKLKLDYTKLHKTNKVNYKKELESIIQKEEDRVAKQKADAKKKADVKNKKESQSNSNTTTNEYSSSNSYSETNSNGYSDGGSTSNASSGGTSDGSTSSGGSQKPETHTCPPDNPPEHTASSWYDEYGCIYGYELEDGTIILA